MVIVTIAGDPGSGKSTLARQLAEHLGVPHFSAGDVFKKIARERGISADEFSKRAEEDPALWDTVIDPYQAKLPSEHESFVIDSRLGFHFIPESVKIYVRCDLEEAARRIMGQGRAEERWSDPKKGAAFLRKRQESERKRYMRLYGVDHTDPSQFDLVIDSTNIEAGEKFRQAIAFLERRT